MRRKAEQNLTVWYKSSHKKPLIIRGARQVGKSTLVRNFCKEKKIHLFEINLERYPHLNEIFKKLNPKLAVDNIEDILQKKISPFDNILLFLDEIQSTPSAIPLLRYFYEEMPNLSIIAAGSLLEFTLNDHEYAMPVGRIDFMFLGPMDFEEFLWAKNEKYFVNKIAKINSPEQITLEFHKKGLELLKEYLFIGGMPEAVFVSTQKSIEQVSRIHAQIMQTYQADFVKYAKKNHLVKIQHVFKYLFTNPCIKIKYSNISKDDQARDIKKHINLLEMARVISKIHHTKCNGFPLNASEDENVFKVILLDIGLMNSMSEISWKTFSKLSDHEIITFGKIAEQFIGQQLLSFWPNYKQPRLNYWLREGKSNNAEVDYVLEYDGTLIALEVKAGAAGKIRSLNQLMQDVPIKNKKAIRFNTSKGELENTIYPLITLPLYTVNWLKNFL
ncbi:MAG: hypothetical protein A2381_00470 [Bdellovibrionales bacterium RIFOXYB1_FULL_37_110]|nr:MAG: hypothetical protein A2417_11525 [Bdellovibrionales bacterium RIFOXYC1_FULL_37_79]OFZ60535.1 MAG: hypothetical protein A2328_10150 [Bdellovibrionales bacterium RIFOXYB2_FULL_36_6]OFZ60868.1 MAG: hypothetical protein A2381_00470 [Bdellovibrionales bacterium RIFOXYB1_FULL_37_110]OFZ62398.1 MAG: hypothetical protein A2577_03135 [Bdellovibrionales bacterium RIFOXYD1_FULL_36_51]